MWETGAPSLFPESWRWGGGTGCKLSRPASSCPWFTLGLSSIFFLQSGRELRPFSLLGPANVIPFCSDVVYDGRGHVSDMWAWVSPAKWNGTTRSFLTNGERLCRGAEKLGISCAVAGAKEEESVGRRRLGVCGWTMGSRAKTQQRSGRVKKWKNRQDKAGKTMEKTPHG